MNYLKASIAFVGFLLAQLNCSSQGWVTVKLDSIASLDFPAVPDTSETDGKQMLLARDTAGGAYTLIETTIDQGNLNTGFLSVIYVSFVQGITKSENVHDAVEKDFKTQGLLGKEVSYKILSPGSEPIAATTRALYTNGILYAYTCASSDTTGVYSACSKRFLESLKISGDVKLNQPTTLTDGVMKLAKPGGYLLVFILLVLIAIGIYSAFKKKDNRTGPDEQGRLS